MKKIAIFSNILFLILITNYLVIAQVKKTVTPKKANEIVKTIDRPVTIFLKEGEPLKAILRTSNVEGIQIGIAGNTLTLKWIDISQITFTDVSEIKSVDNPKAQLEIKKKESVSNALKSLRKLTVATEVGINLLEYGRRLIDVKSEVNESLRDIPDGNVKNEIVSAMEAYSDAATVWNEMGTEKFIDAASLRGIWLKLKYSIPTVDVVNKKMMYKDTIISTIWGNAGKHIENVEKFIK